MRALATWLGHLRALSSGTARTWWTTLPGVLVALGLSFVVFRALLVVAAFISAAHAWLALVVVATGFTALLAGYLVALRLVGQALQVRRHLADLGEDEGSSDSLVRSLAITLLPFLAIYAVFGKVQEVSAELVTYEVILRGMLAPGVLRTINPQTAHQRWVVLAVLVGAYLLRRLLDHVHDRTRIRVLGLLTALVETFFLLVLIYGGARLLNRARAWLTERAVHHWWELARDRVAALLAEIHVDLPHWIHLAWQAITGPLWSWASSGLLEPMLWLALAGLAFGSRVMSMSELVRETIGQRPGRLSRLPLSGQTGAAGRVAAELRSLFFGDLDDKYAPTVQSVRLVLSGGFALIGAFCLLHALAEGLFWAVNRVVELWLGPADSAFWVSLRTPIDLAQVLVAEPIRLALLGVTYVRCLQVLVARVQGRSADRLPDATAPATASSRSGDEPAARRTTTRTARLRRYRRHLPDLALALAGVVFAGWVSQAVDSGRNTAEVPGRVREELPLSRAGQTLEVRDLTGSSVVLLAPGQNRVQSDGRLIVIGVRLRSPGERLVRGVSCFLAQDGERVKPVFGGTLVPTPEPGFQNAEEIVFERPAGRIEGTALHCTPTGSINAYDPEVVVDLTTGEGRYGYEESSEPVPVSLHEPEVIR